MSMEAVAQTPYARAGNKVNSENEPPFRPQPNSVEETGIGFGQLLDLCIKTIYFNGRPSARQVSEQLALPFNVIETVLSFLKREKFIEVVGSSGIGEQQYQYALSRS